MYRGGKINHFDIIAAILIILFYIGGNGYTNDYPASRLLRDAKLFEIGAGTSDMRRLLIGRAINAEYGIGSIAN